MLILRACGAKNGNKYLECCLCFKAIKKSIVLAFGKRSTTARSATAFHATCFDEYYLRKGENEGIEEKIRTRTGRDTVIKILNVGATGT